jgi:predicted cobalt transporter CbtA
VNRTMEGIVWVAMVICLAVAIALIVRGSTGQAVVFGCVAVVLAIAGGSTRRRASGSRGPQTPSS